jgi:hypothetical protein
MVAAAAAVHATQEEEVAVELHAQAQIWALAAAVHATQEEEAGVELHAQAQIWDVPYMDARSPLFSVTTMGR